MSSSNISILKVLSVESDRAIRQEIHDLFVKIEDIDLAAEVPSVDDARSILPGSNLDIALVDLAGEQTFDLIKEIRQSSKSMRVVVVTASDSPEDIFSAMDAGADAYVLKRNLNKALVSAVRSVCLNTIWLDPDMAAEVLAAIESATTAKVGRVLPTGLMTLPLMPDEKDKLNELSQSDCKDGVCMVDASFLNKLRRFGPSKENG